MEGYNVYPPKIGRQITSTGRQHFKQERKIKYMQDDRIKKKLKGRIERIIIF